MAIKNSTRFAVLFFILSASLSCFSQTVPPATFSSAQWGFRPKGPTQDFWCIYGSNTKTVELTEIRISVASCQYSPAWCSAAGVAAPPVYLRVMLFKRAGQDSGGISLQQQYNQKVPSIVAYDSTDSPTATVIAWNISPSNLPQIAPGTGLKSVDLIAGESLAPILLYKHDPTLKPLTLRGVNEGACVNLDGYDPGPGLNYINVEAEWAER